jgi:hypothetical protein
MVIEKVYSRPSLVTMVKVPPFSMYSALSFQKKCAGADSGPVHPALEAR